MKCQPICCFRLMQGASFGAKAVLDISDTILLLLWMTNVELVRRFVPPAPQEGMLEVTLLSADGSDGGEGAEPGQAMHDPSRELQFTGRQRSLTAAAQSAPSGMIGSPTRTLTAPACGNQESERKIERVPLIVTGTIGAVASAAAVKAPIWNGSRPGIRVKVPSGKNSRE